MDKEVRFVYDGWNLIAELDENNLPTRTYTWGIDLSGSEQGAGGVGGLLKVSDGSDYYPSYDANGNITSYVDSSGTKVDEVVYSPFGKMVSGSLPVCPFGFSSKYVDEENGLVYYGYRYYDAGNGRWLNRDPIGEAGGTNIFVLVNNNPINIYDFLGLATWSPWECKKMNILEMHVWDCYAFQDKGYGTILNYQWALSQSAKDYGIPAGANYNVASAIINAAGMKNGSSFYNLSFKVNKVCKRYKIIKSEKCKKCELKKWQIKIMLKIITVDRVYKDKKAEYQIEKDITKEKNTTLKVKYEECVE